ncbi:lipopolysaccharide biosynthesis protein [Carnobacterium funditum]|uniref:lipopolysaccharide biosynthesis protein n=1 Tax=Carnobacterium funditum TaxID=2752 RepID=UPI00054D2CE5|nr:polysaccharide biosynthesis protein [Carnobacterium funditum]
MQLIKNIIRVSIANVMNFGSSFIVGFILPAYLSVAEYGMYKEYTLYLSFVYIFNFGFNDGIYIKYGGKDYGEINKKELHEEHTFITLFQFIVFLCMLAFSFIIKDLILILFSIVTLFMSIITYHQNFAQATGNFKVYSNANIFKTIINISTILFAIFILNSSDYVIYIIMNIVTNIFIFLLYEVVFLKEYGLNFRISFKNKVSIFKIGIFVLIANMSMTFVGNIGSWVVNFGFPIEDFSQYSFSTSMLNLILLIVNAVGLIFYNIISKNENEEMLKFTKRILLLLGIIGGLLFFVFKVIIEVFLSKYTPALSLLSITFISIPYIMVANVIITNLYKSRKNEKKYFRDVIAFATSSLILVGSVYLITDNMTSIALATTFAYIFWYLYSTNKEYKYLKSTKREYLLLISHFIVFYLTANYVSNIWGAFLYLIYIIIVSIMFRNDFKKIILYARK